VKRVLAYTWFCAVMGITAWLPDVRPVLRLRGWLVKGCFASCGRRFEVAGGVRITFTNRVHIGDDVYIAPGCWIQGRGGVTIGDQVMFGPYTIIATNDHTKQDGSYRFADPITAPIRFGRGAWTGGHVVVTAGVTVGAGAACAAGAVVTKDVPDHAIVGGVPARVLRQESQ
jgi:acetyltransferase-like isoleucine patch superfamily enzyme